MNRRDFIKTSLCLGAAAATCGCIYGSKLVYNSEHPENKFRLKHKSDLPKKVRLEACNKCQLNCAACWIRAEEQRIIDEGGGFGYLKFEDFKNFVDKHDFIKEIELSNNGEIFLNPELDDIIKYAYEKNIQLSAQNGVNLNTVSDETLENLVKYKFNAIMVSLDGATPETYSIYRRGGDFNTVISHIKTINKFKEKYNSPYPHLVWQFILFGHNEHEIDKAREMAKELNMEMVYCKNYVTDYSPLKNPKLAQEKTGVHLIDEPEEENNENTEITPEEEKKETKEELAAEIPENTDGRAEQDIETNERFCYQLEYEPQINFNGDLLGCCILSYKNFGTNVFKEGLLGALNSKKVLQAKLMLSDFTTEPYEDNPCSTCGLYTGFKEQNRPIKFKLG
ncbi:radical SAM protein [bacterium]|nr:radical SAM protein [bacterium]